MTKSSLATIALAFLAPVSMATAQTAFTQYASPDGAFTVLFPGTPAVSDLQTHTRSDGITYTERRYSVDDDGGYLVDVADYPSASVIPDVETGASAEANGCGGTYVIRNRDTYQGHTGALIQVNCPASGGQGGMVVVEQFVQIGNRIYMAAYGAATLNADRSSQFLGSLHIN